MGSDLAPAAARRYRRAMTQSLTIKVTKPIARWLKKAAWENGVAAGEFAARELERAKLCAEKPFMRMAGILDGPADLSRREGFAR